MIFVLLSAFNSLGNILNVCKLSGSAQMMFVYLETFCVPLENWNTASLQVKYNNLCQVRNYGQCA